MSAAMTGQLFPGDVIMSVNGESLLNAKHDEAVKILKKSGQVVDLQGLKNKMTIVIAQILVQYRRDLLGKRDNILQKLSWDDDEFNYTDFSRMRSFSLKLAFVTRQKIMNKFKIVKFLDQV